MFRITRVFIVLRGTPEKCSAFSLGLPQPFLVDGVVHFLFVLRRDVKAIFCSNNKAALTTVG